MHAFRLLLWLFCFHDAFAVKHYLRFFMTASSGTQDLPELMVFSTFDDVQWGYCDSSGRLELQQEWARRLCQDNPQHVRMYSEECERLKYFLSGYIENLNQQMNQTEGVHTFQRMHGCEWDDETEDVGGIIQYGYDGEDFISFDLQTSTWVAAKPQTLITKHKWDRDLLYCESIKNFQLHICPERLKMYFGYWKRFKKNTAGASVSLLQRTPSSPVSCHVTGFYPDNAEMFWRRDGQEVHEDVQYWEILPNHDDTFQMTVELNISLIKPEDWRRYECVFHLSGVKEEIVTRLDRANIITNWVPPSEFPVVTVVAVVVPGLLLLALCISGLYLWRRKYSGFWPANLSDPSLSQTSSEAEALK
ncbi:major histocompatibility complex class I-related protein 1-like isoform X1 [Nelusetta ayraudi]|uniref:major histocompatibility complex class I-related protein 1-like isoform X1 n=1 Tax=Nelusetta ayraudi TaxID=303726 RepID=UPI003F70F006